MKVFEGKMVVAPGARFGIVASRFNHLIVDRLIEGARDALVRHGAEEENLELVWVPGAWELPWAVRKLAQEGDLAAVIALGAVIRGATPHFDYVASAATNGCAGASGSPVAFGLLTTDTIEQALERAGTKAGNKGWEAATAAIEMASLATVLEGR